MSPKKNSIAAFVGNRESMKRVLAKVQKDVGGRGLLGLIQTRPDRQPQDSDEGWTLSSRPSVEEIDHDKSSPDMILKGHRAVLRNGRRLTWP
jgi:hypothetical protein